MVYNILKTS